MAFIKRVTLILMLLNFYALNFAYGQLWRYIGDTPKKEKEYEKELSKEAIEVSNKRNVAYGDTFSYTIRTYLLKAIDSLAARITIYEKPFSHKFHIDCVTDSLTINDFSALARVHIFSPTLLEVVYSPRGGSDEGYDNVLLLAVNKGKFCIVMEIQSVDEYSYPDAYGVYNLNIKLTRQNTADYQLLVNVHDLKQVKEKRKNYNHYFNYTLKYNNKLNLFYSANKYLNTVADIWNYKTNKTESKHIKGNIPLIKLGKQEYYYFNAKWYSGGKDSLSSKYRFVNYCHRL